MRKFLIGLLVLVGLLAIGTYLTPRMVHVEREIQAAAPPTKVYSLINGFKRYAEWSPWHEQDPSIKGTVSGPETGVGATYAWTSEKSGSGTQKITNVKDNEEVYYDLDFGNMGTAKAFFRLVPESGGQATHIVWGFDTDLGLNPVARWMGLRMPGWISADYDRGLAKLKAVAEKP